MKGDYGIRPSLVKDNPNNYRPVSNLVGRGRELNRWWHASFVFLDDKSVLDLLQPSFIPTMQLAVVSLVEDLCVQMHKGSTSL